MVTSEALTTRIPSNCAFFIVNPAMVTLFSPAWWKPSTKMPLARPVASMTDSPAPAPMIGLDVHKRTISYCVKDGSGRIHAEGTIPATRFDLDRVTGLSTAQTFSRQLETSGGISATPERPTFLLFGVGLYSFLTTPPMNQNAVF